jgi:thiamine biosynthesis lipoprotein
MVSINRRRFLMISAAAVVAGRPAYAEPLRQWRGNALGAEVLIALSHPHGDRISARAFEEIERLEGIFSLYRAESELSRLNRDGALSQPSFELLECLGLCNAVRNATGGAFDPTVQPLWRYYADVYTSGREPDPRELEQRRGLVDLHAVQFGSTGIDYLKPGMAMTLNGIAQGFIADKVAGLLRAEGLINLLVNTGEIQALGNSPDGDGQGWPVSLKAGDVLLSDAVRLQDRALASSAPLGTTIDGNGRVSHVISPRTGRPAEANWQLVSISSNSAAIADALSTAGCLMSKVDLLSAIESFPGAKLERLV